MSTSTSVSTSTSGKEVLYTYTDRWGKERTWAAEDATEWDSPKQRDFVLGGLKDPATQEYYPVTSMGGVGKVTGEKLCDLGFSYAYNLIGQYMVNSLDEEATSHWLENEVGVKRKELRTQILNTMNKWCERHL